MNDEVCCQTGKSDEYVFLEDFFNGTKHKNGKSRKSISVQRTLTSAPRHPSSLRCQGTTSKTLAHHAVGEKS